MIDAHCEILANEPLRADCYRMTLKGPPGYVDCRPGQFVMQRSYIALRTHLFGSLSSGATMIDTSAFSTGLR